MSITSKSVDNIVSNLNKKLQGIQNKTLTGLIKGAKLIYEDMKTTPPLIPVDLGNLEDSFFIVTSNKGVIRGNNVTFTGDNAGKISEGHLATIQEAKGVSITGMKGPFVVFGFGAYYAVYVHEMIEASFQKQGSGALFLSNAIARNSNMVIKTVAQEAKSK
jgi:hypothetical protein